MYIKAIQIEIQTDSGPFGFFTEFSRNLNIIRGRNSAGKSTIVHAIMYAMGMEELLGAQNENALTYALLLYTSPNPPDPAGPLVWRLLLGKKKKSRPFSYTHLLAPSPCAIISYRLF
ncbi:ATP-binding protein, partial [Pseudomonas syringae]|uniref:ATP-binding protein n=1 Tax=Pseudomonas syringae TaxID=317 RepID=UPI001F2601EC